MQQQSYQASTDNPIRIKHDAAITIATATSRKSTSWKNQDMLYSDFLKQVSSTVRTKETVAEYMKLPKSEQDEIKDVGGFVGGSLKGGRRKAESVAWRQIVTLDADFIQGDFWAGVTTTFDHACMIYSTHKHTSQKPRIRLVIPLAQPVSAEEYVAVAKKLAEQFGIDYFDDTTYQPHRLMYWASTSADGEFLFDYQDAEWVNPTDILNLYNDWRDPHEWPESSRQRESRKKLADKQGNPLEKSGTVGAFCRTYSITEAIEEFLSDVYTEAGDGRYTFVGGTTNGGLVLYDDLFAYSHHGTDPVSEKLVNAFDLVRIHLYGDMDADESEGTATTKLPSYAAMRERVKDLPKVKEAFAVERIQQAMNDFDGELDDVSSAPEETDLKWSAKLTMNDKGEIENTAQNIKLILDNAPQLKKTMGFNEFSKQPVALRDLPWRKLDKGIAWGNADDAQLRTYLDIVWDLRPSNQKVADVIEVVQQENAFHPVRDFLESCSWDGQSRVETVLIDYLGAADNDYTRAVTRMTFAAAVARIFEPGCKYDYMLTLVGAQGIGKSMLFNKLANGWYSDSLTSIGGKEAYEALHGVWIMEMAELAATRKAEVEAIKHFLTKQVDRYRVAYGKRTEEFPRQCIFIGTTNEDEFLRDKTGNRRFLPVPVKHGSKKSWADITSDEVKQIWAEAVQLYKNNEPRYLTDEVAEMALAMQNAHTEESSYTGQIIEFLERPITSDWYNKSIADRRLAMNQSHDFADEDEFGLGDGLQRDKICSLEIWCECLGKDRANFPPRERHEINGILATLDGWKKHSSTIRFGGEYGSQRGFVRK